MLKLTSPWLRVRSTTSVEIRDAVAECLLKNEELIDF